MCNYFPSTLLPLTRFSYSLTVRLVRLALILAASLVIGEATTNLFAASQSGSSAGEEARDYPMGPIGGTFRITDGASHARVVGVNLFL